MDPTSSTSPISLNKIANWPNVFRLNKDEFRAGNWRNERIASIRLSFRWKSTQFIPFCTRAPALNVSAKNNFSASSAPRGIPKPSALASPDSKLVFEGKFQDQNRLSKLSMVLYTGTKFR